MECSTNTTDHHLIQEDLIDFSSDNEALEPNHCEMNAELKRNKSAPLLKSKDRLHLNSDVVAIKQGNGDVAFVAVGRVKPQMDDNKLKYKRKPSTAQTWEDVEHACGRGIDNPGYATMPRGESYSYDQTGENYFSTYPERWNHIELMTVDLPDLKSDRLDPAPVLENAGNIDFTDNCNELVFDLESNTDNNNILDAISETNMSASQTHQVTSLNLTEENASSELNPDLGNNPQCSETVPIKLPPYCKSCGQRHGVTENHEFNYMEEVDEDLTCDICLQPLVDPFDTKCGHSFCSICIKNYLRVKHMCPIDRQEMENTSSDCWQSSIVLRKLINKLLVQCPNEKYCKETMQRCDLKNHLKERCPGAIIRCPKSMYGCIHKAARILIEQHLDICEFKDYDHKLSDLHPFCEDMNIELFRPEGTAELGIMIVGGIDTPLHYIIIQHITPDSLAHQDGRLHCGDVIVEINGEPLYSVTHAEARAALTKPSNLMRFGILREVVPKTDEPNVTTPQICRSNSVKQVYEEECVCLIKPPLEQLGIRISTCETGCAGVYIVELIDGQVAQTDGRLQVGDRIMAIGNTDLSVSTPEQAARVIGNCGDKIKILVRHESSSDNKLLKEIDLTGLSEKNSFHPPSTLTESSHKRKAISIIKSPKENLGIIVSGGYNSQHGNLPIFVQDVLSMSVLGMDNRIKRGDLLYEINSSKLIGLTHAQAMVILRECAQQREVNIVACELVYKGMEEDASLWDELTSLHQHPTKWAPSWRMWLSVTPEFVIAREVILRKNVFGSYGIRITGGFTNELGPSPIFITHVTSKPSSQASRFLKSGDEIIAVNKRHVKGMPYLHVLNLMKSMNSVLLKIVSWPGSLH